MAGSDSVDGSVDSQAKLTPSAPSGTAMEGRNNYGKRKGGEVLRDGSTFSKLGK